MGILDRVLLGGAPSRPADRARREDVFVVAVQCGAGRRHLLLRLDGHRPDRASRASTSRSPRCSRTAATTSWSRSAASAARELLAELPLARGRAGRAGRPPRAAHAARPSQMGRELDIDRHQGAALPQLRAPALGRGRRALPDAAATARWSARPASARRVEDVTDLAGEHVERHQRWDSCFTVDYSHIHGGAVRASHALALPPVDDAQARHLDRPVRHLRLRRLRALHHLVPGRHRHHRGGARDPRERRRPAMQTLDELIAGRADLRRARRSATSS